MELWTSMASLLGTLAFFQAFLRAVIPPEFLHAAAALLRRLSVIYSPYCYFDITETDGVSTNELYSAVKTYLSSSAPDSASRLSLSRPLNSSAFLFGVANNDRILDSFAGATAAWKHVVTQRSPASFSWRGLPVELRNFTLSIRKEDKALFFPAYFNHIMNTAADIHRRNQDRLLYTNSRSSGIDSRIPWESVPFKHPSTFDTLAMDPIRKNDIMADLRRFAAGQSFYQKTGRAWKRGYLLFGPPGTGKSSLIAAMANFLGYDIYDLELTEVYSNSDLRKLLMKTTSKSIIVIEDIDCSVSLSKRGNPPPPAVSLPDDSAPARLVSAATTAKSITLSGLLNFTDGLWSSCGSEKIFVFTTNHIEMLDSALLRSGRMDMKIHMSFCSFPALKILMRNYLDMDDAELDDGNNNEDLFKELKVAIEAVEITPADVSEVLIKNGSSGKRKAMEELLEELKKRAAVNNTKDATGKGEVEEEEEQEKRALESPKNNDELAGRCDEKHGKKTEVEDQIMGQECK